jgi:hypothetical protein
MHYFIFVVSGKTELIFAVTLVFLIMTCYFCLCCSILLTKYTCFDSYRFYNFSMLIISTNVFAFCLKDASICFITKNPLTILFGLNLMYLRTNTKRFILILTANRLKDPYLLKKKLSPGAKYLLKKHKCPAKYFSPLFFYNGIFNKLLMIM